MIDYDIRQISLNNASAQTIGSISGASREKDQFQSILKDVILNPRSEPGNSKALSNISSQQLELLARALQVQMNHKMYHALFNQAAESNFLADHVIRAYGNGGTEASNNRHVGTDNHSSVHASNLDTVIEEASRLYCVDTKLIRSVIEVESGFNPKAVSEKGAMGLMQLMPETASELGVKDPYDARENVLGGTRYLKMLLDRYEGNTNLALAAYNWGMGNLEKKPDGLPQETMAYIEKVRAGMNKKS